MALGRPIHDFPRKRLFPAGWTECTKSENPFLDARAHRAAVAQKHLKGLPVTCSRDLCG